MEAGPAGDVSVLSLVRERKPTETRATSARTGPGKKSQFQLKREAERLKGQQGGPKQDGPTPTRQPIASHPSAEDDDDVWLDANGAPLSAFKKAALQSRGQGPPGGTARNPANSTSSTSAFQTDGASTSTSHKVTDPQSTSSSDDFESISKENEAKIAAMSAEQVQREVQELQDQIGSDLLEKFKQLAAVRSNHGGAAPSQNSVPSSSAQSQLQPSTMAAVAKKSVTFNLPQASHSSQKGTSDLIVASDNEAASELKFHEHTDMSGLNDIVVTQAGLLLLPDEGIDPSRSESQAVEETYTISMLLSLAQSSATAQRKLGLTILDRVTVASSEQLEAKLGSERYIRRILRVAALASRYTLSAQHHNESAVARRCLLSIMTYLSHGAHLKPSEQRNEARLPAGSSAMTDSVGMKTTVVAPILSNSSAEGHLPEDLERDLAQARPNSSAASLLTSDLVDSGLIEAMRSDLLWSDRILTTSKASQTFAPSSTLYRNGDLMAAMEGVIETAAILDIIAQSSDLHAETMTDEESAHGVGSASSKGSKDTILQILVKHGIRNRRWPPVDDDSSVLNVSPEVLSLIGTVCHSTPRAALKLAQQTNIANVLLRFVALPPWSLDEPDQGTQTDAKTETADRARRWSLTNWHIFSSALQCYLGLSKHSLEGSLLDAWSLWLDISAWIQSASFSVSLSSSDVSPESSLRVEIQTIQLEAVSRVLQLFSSWIERAVGSEGDFEDLTWTDVSPTKDVALSVLGSLGTHRSQQAASASAEGSASVDMGEASGGAQTKYAMHLRVFTSAVNLILTWLQAADQTARLPAREMTKQLQLNTDLYHLFNGVLGDSDQILESRARPVVGAEEQVQVSISLGQAAIEAVAAIHQMSRFLGLAIAPAGTVQADRTSWRSLCAASKVILTRCKGVYSKPV